MERGAWRHGAAGELRTRNFRGAMESGALIPLPPFLCQTPPRNADIPVGRLKSNLPVENRRYACNADIPVGRLEFNLPVGKPALRLTPTFLSAGSISICRLENRAGDMITSGNAGFPTGRFDFQSADRNVGVTRS